MELVETAIVHAELVEVVIAHEALQESVPVVVTVFGLVIVLVVVIVCMVFQVSAPGVVPKALPEVWRCCDTLPWSPWLTLAWTPRHLRIGESGELRHCSQPRLPHPKRSRELHWS